MLQRQVAYKTQIKDILGGNAVFDGDRFSALECAGKRILRVNIVGNIIDKYVNGEKRYCTLTLDDGSGQIRLKGFSDQFDLLNKPEIGDTVYLVGMIKYFNNELYVMPEVMRKVEPIWLSVRSLELGMKPGEHQSNQNSGYSAQQQQPAVIATEKVSSEEKVIQIPQNSIDSPKLRALNAIKKEGEIDLNRLGTLTGISSEEINSIINDLLSEGEIFEPKPGYLCAVN